MKFHIVYDKPGRIRFRCGKYAFEKEYEETIFEAFQSESYVLNVEVHAENCGILVLYKKGFRDNVISFLQNLNIQTLSKVANAEYSIQKIDTNFKNQLTKMIVKRYLMKALLPLPVAHFITTVRSLKYIRKAVRTLLNGKLTVDVLDGASISACILQKNYKTAGTIMFLLSISSLLEDYTRVRTKAALTESLAINTDNVWLVQPDADILIPIKELKKGDVIRVRTGSLIPVDGTVVSGEGFVNESSMTGESASVMKTEGSTVFAGTVLEDGNIAIEVEKISSDTKISKIIELIDNSENLKAGIQSKAENLADGIVPFSFIGFFATLLLTRNITKAVSLLMVDYSCAIKLSTPISVISALKEAADMNITVKGGKYLESFSNADTIVFDKTGTLTKAEPMLEKVIPFGTYTEEEVLKISACLEEHFPHSVAKAIVKGAAERGINHEEEHAEVEYIVAHGIASILHGERAVIGSKHFICEDENVILSDEIEKKIEQESGASSVIYLAIGGKLAGVVCISDPPRPEAASVIQELRCLNIDNVYMLTGDSTKAAEIIANKLGIKQYKSQILPEDKYTIVESLKAQGYKVIMVGDGINDAPALAAADVSVAMSDASDIARETADITLRSSNLNDLIRLRKLSNDLMNRINKNYRFIVSFNSSLLILGFTGVISPSLSALLHNASTMAICMKSMSKLENKKKN